jgi:hypothetical protein
LPLRKCRGDELTIYSRQRQFARASAHGAFAAVGSNAGICTPARRSTMTLNDVFDVMLDVSALVTRGSDLARTEARRVVAERERRADEQARRLADQTALLPASTVAVGVPEQPVERLLTLQSAIARAVHLVTVVPGLRLRLPFNGLLRIRPW